MNTNVSWPNGKDDAGRDVVSQSSQQIFLLTVAYPLVAGPNEQIKAVAGSSCGSDENVAEEDHIVLQPASVVPLSKSKHLSATSADKQNGYTAVMVLDEEDGRDCSLPAQSHPRLHQVTTKYEINRSCQTISYETSNFSEFSCNHKDVVVNCDAELNPDPDPCDNSLEMTQQLKYTTDIRNQSEAAQQTLACCADTESESESGGDQAARLVPDKRVMPRARQTLPLRYLTLQQVTCSNRSGETAVFARRQIGVRTQFGPMDGVREAAAPSQRCTPLRLLIHSSTAPPKQLSVDNEELSNWMRYVRVAQTAAEQNLSLSQINGNLYFTTIKTIESGQELKVWYSTKYAVKRNLPLLSEGAEKWRCCKCTFACSSDTQMGNHLTGHLSHNKASKRNLDSSKLSKSIKSQRTRAAPNISPSDQTAVKNVRCDRCDVGFSTTAHLNIHMLMHAADNLEAPPPTPAPSNQEDESVEELARSILCSVCDKQFADRVLLEAHYQSHYHKSSYECPLCKVAFNKLTCFKRHIDTHKRNAVFPCPLCHKSFATYKKIRKHVKMAHSDRSFQCPTCVKTFPSADKLRIHLLSHSSQKQFLCLTCGKQFKRKDKLCRHIKSVHQQVGAARQAGYQTLTAPLASPSPTATRRRPAACATANVERDCLLSSYKCGECDVWFKRRGMLVNHVLSRHPHLSLHSVPDLNQPILRPTRDYLCQYCDKIYKSSTKRKAHILKYHPGSSLPPTNRDLSQSQSGAGCEMGVESYTQTVGSVSSDPQSCEWCSKQYASKAKLLQHQRKVHYPLMPPSLRRPASQSSASTSASAKPQRTKKPLPMEASIKETVSESAVTKPQAQDDNPVDNRTNVIEVADSDTSLQVLSDGIIVDGPTLKKALKLGEPSSMECVLDSGLEQLLAENRPDQFFKVSLRAVYKLQGFHLFS